MAPSGPRRIAARPLPPSEPLPPRYDQAGDRGGQWARDGRRLRDRPGLPLVVADEALRYGLVNRVTEAGQALAGAQELAAEILEGSPTSVRISLALTEQTQGIADTIDAVTPPDRAAGRADGQRGRPGGDDGLRPQAQAAVA